MADINPLDSDSVMDEVGEVIPIILREAIDSGFDVFRRSRDGDVKAHADYSPSTLAGMLTDRIYPFLVALTALVDPQQLQMQARRTENDRATELFLGADFYIKVKRMKDRRRPATPADDVEVDGMIDLEIIEEGLPKNIQTCRVERQLSPRSVRRSQLILPGIPPVQVAGDEYNRWCLFAGFDLDATADRIERHRIGLYEKKRSLWTEPLPELELTTIARISPALAGQVDALRKARQA